MGNHIDITMANSGVSFNRPLHAIRFGRGSLELQHDWHKINGQSHPGVGNERWFANVSTTTRNSTAPASFSSTATRPDSAIRAGFDRADFLLGAFSFFTQNSGELEQRRGTQTGWYFGDTWRVRPGLTLNFGIRYEPYSSVQGQTRPEPDVRSRREPGGHPISDFQECVARAVLSRRQEARGLRRRRHFRRHGDRSRLQQLGSARRLRVGSIQRRKDQHPRRVCNLL